MAKKKSSSPKKPGKPRSSRADRSKKTPAKANGGAEAATNGPDADATTAPQAPNIPIVGIGASAGGLAALKRFFAQTPADSGLAYVIVVHLSPEHESHLAELLQPHVKFPVQQVTETVKVERNRVFVIPPNANLDAIDTHLRLSKLEPRRQERAPIDHFFRTLAKTHDGHGIGVILTGTGSDGTLGLREVKEGGGLCIVQDPNEAEYDGMPQSAIATGIVDLILPLAKIPDAILRFVRTQPHLPQPTEAEELDAEARQLLQKVFGQIKARTGRDFSRYKRSTILRRIQRRMQLLQIEELEAYITVLRQRADEVATLADDLLITVTNFFRDAKVYDYLAKRVIPDLFKEKSSDDTLRIWSVGCATGEEAYSLAMLLLEESARGDSSPKFQIFASDLHEHSLTRGREGFYPGDIETDVSAERLKRFFVKDNGGYRIRKEVRELVVFAPHNLLGDPPFSRLDLICCRNVLIYIQRDAQRDIIELFHYALRHDGYLVLGTSETVEAGDLFRTLDKKSCVFRKRNVPGPEPRLPVFPFTQPRLATHPDGDDQQREPVAYANLHQRMVERFALPSALVSPEDKIVHLSPGAGRYMVHPAGELTSNIYKLVREELRVELRGALHDARRTRQAVHAKPIFVQFNGDRHSVAMHVQPAAEQAQDGFVLITFEEAEHPKLAASPPQAKSAKGGKSRAKSNADSRLEALEAELSLSNQHLQAIIEEYETSQEEMKAANEELQSTNEELRSTMEELETGKEELQSMNEELQTVNQENRHKVEELAQLSSDLQNLLAATDIATLFLDRSFRILRFTPKVADLFNVRLTDRGRPISDLTHRLGYESLMEDAEAVLRRLVPIEREIRDQTDRWYLTRVMPYRSAEDRIEGIVITFVEITDRRRAEDALRDADRRKNEFLAMLAHELRNPLAPIRSGLDVLRLGADDPATFEQVRETIERQTDQLVALVDDLLDVSRITQGKLELKIRPTPLESIVQTAVESTQALMQAAEQVLEVRLPNEPVIVHGDPRRLSQVVANLLSNAAKYTPQGGRIWLDASTANGDLSIAVRDTGVGIAQDKLATVFEMFSQIDNGEKQGLGIGLTLARQLVELHGGSIEARSPGVGEGCEFHVLLPALRGRKQPALNPPAITTNADTAKLRVLVVDDNVDAAATLGKLIGLMGHDVTIVHSGEDAIARGDQLRPDLVLLDLGMPGMDGFETARRIRREAWSEAAVIAALTGWGQEDDRQRAKEAGFDEHLVKPVDKAVLQRLFASVRRA